MVRSVVSLMFLVCLIPANRVPAQQSKPLIESAKADLPALVPEWIRQAKTITEGLIGVEAKTLPLEYIAKAQTLAGDGVGARQTVDSIAENVYKAEALAEIAEAIGKIAPKK